MEIISYYVIYISLEITLSNFSVLPKFYKLTIEI